MSTGDQSEYLRGKAAVRGKAALSADPKFMRDGFNNWAAKTEVGVGGRMMAPREPSGGRRKRGSYLKGLLDGGAEVSDSPEEITKKSEELANRGLRAAIKMNKKLLAGEDAEAESEEFNSLMNKWSNYAFGLSVEDRKYVSDGSADLSAQAAELQNRVDKMAFDQRQKARSSGSGGAMCGAGLIEDVGSFVGVLGGELKNVAQKGIDFYNRAKPIATGVRKVLQLPPMKKIMKDTLGDQATNTINSVTNFMQMIGLGKYASDPKMQEKVGSSKSYKEYATGKYNGVSNLFKKLSPGRDVNTDVKKALQEQKKRLKQLAKQYSGSGLNGGAAKSLFEKATEWANQAIQFYNKIALKAPDFYNVLNAPDTEDLLRDAYPADPQIGKKIAGAIKFVFPNVGSGKGKKSCCRGCDAGGECMEGSGFMEDIGEAFGVRRKEEAMGRIREEPMGRISGQQVGIVGKGGRKPSAYAMFVKQYAAKHPGPDLMKRAAAAWKSQK